MDWERVRWLWDRGVKASIEASAMILEGLAWPLVAADYGGGVLVCSETSDSPYAAMLDRDAGIDAIVWRDSPRAVRGLAHRAQDCSKRRGRRSWDTFTIRSRLAWSGNDTEIHKRLRSIEERTLGPNLTLQTYVDLPRERLLSVGVANTDDVMALVLEHQLPDGGWPIRRFDRPVYTESNRGDGNQFVAVEWWALAARRQIRVYPTPASQLSLL